MEEGKGFGNYYSLQQKASVRNDIRVIFRWMEIKPFLQTRGKENYKINLQKTLVLIKYFNQ